MFIAVIVPLILFGVALYSLWKGSPGFQKEYRDVDEGLADLLRYNRMIKDGVVLGKGGELMAGFWFRGVDMDSSTNSQIIAIMARLNAAHTKFDSGWMVHIDAIRGHAVGYPDEGAFYHPILKLMDEERRMQYKAEGTHYESQYAVVVTWLPPVVFDAKAGAMFYEHSAERQALRNLRAKTLQKFEERINEFGSAIGQIFHDVVRMRSEGTINKAPPAVRIKKVSVDAFAGYLHYCATGIPQNISLSASTAVDLDVVIGSQDFVGGNTPKVGRLNVRCVTIEGYPSECAPLVLEQLNRLRVQYRWSTRFIFFDPEDAKSVIGRIRKKWRQKMRPVADQVFNRSGVIDQDAMGMAVDAEAAYAEASSGLVKHGHYTSVVVLMDDDESVAEESALIIKRSIEDMGFGCRIEDVNAVEAYLGSLPGHGYENVRRPLMHTMNLAYLFPATATWGGPTTHPCKFYPPKSPPLFMADSAGGTPFRGVLHVGDVGHALAVGPTGAGKSTLIQFLIAQHFRYEKARVILFEKGYSGYVLASSIKGQHYDVGGEHARTAYAPLADIDRPTERSWAEDWICICLELQGVQITPRHRAKIKDALEKTAENLRDDRTMTHLVAQIQDEELRETLKFYTVEGSNAYVDAVPSDENIEFARYSVFEMEHLMEMGEKHVVPILLYLFHKIERSLHGEPTLIVLDEAWLMLTHPLFRERIRMWLKTMRKANVGVVFATQELVDFVNSPIRDVLFASCHTRIYLPNPDALRPDSAALYKDMGLNEQQIDLIIYGTQKRDYYYVSPYGSRLFSLALGAMNLSLVATSGKDEYLQARKLQEELGEQWVVEWVRRRAGNEWANAVNAALLKAAA